MSDLVGNPKTGFLASRLILCHYARHFLLLNALVKYQVLNRTNTNLSNLIHLYMYLYSLHEIKFLAL